MKIEIVKATGAMKVDGVTRTVDVSDLDADIVRVVFNTVVGNGLIEYSARPDRPIGNRDFEVMFGRFMRRWRGAGAPPARTLAQVKRDAKQRMNSIRVSLERGGFVYLGNNLKSDIEAQKSFQLFAFVAKQNPLSILKGFKVEKQDGAGVVTLNVVQMLGLPLALFEHIDALRDKELGKRQQIEAATTIAQVNAITWD